MSEGTEDKLAIYKSQANAASKKKEKALADLKKLEDEERKIEKAFEKKEKEYAQAKGTKFMKHDDFQQYAASLKRKETEYKRMRIALQNIKTEIAVLLNTEKLLKTRSDEIAVQMKAIEVETGNFGMFVYNLLLL